MTRNESPDAVVTAALKAADLPASGVELAVMIARYPALRAAVDALYTVPGIYDVMPISHQNNGRCCGESA